MENKNTYKKHKIMTLKIILMLSIISMLLIPGGIIPVHAAPGDVLSTVEINDSTTNGPTLSNDDLFGVSISNIGDLDGDGVDDIAVGAFFDDEGGSNRGAVHIMFMNTDGSVDSTVEINDSTTNGPTLSDSDSFGVSISNIGDLDGDGVDDIAVGASFDNEGGGSRGAVHIMFMNTDGSVDSTVEINDSTTNGPTLSNGDQFGRSVSNIGDLDGDGVDDIAVGASGDDGGGSNIGAVHIIFLDGIVSPSQGTVSAEKDSFLRKGNPNRNEGVNEILQIRESGNNRALVQFNQTSINDLVGTSTIQNATLRLYIQDNFDNWGQNGRTIDVHHITTPWAEGNGWNLGGNNTRGTGDGTTWKCPTDTDISDSNPDCSTQWSGGDFESTITDSVLITNGLEAVYIEFDVTDDVQAFVDDTTTNNGWIIKKTQEGQSGRLQFASSENAANNPELVIQLGS